MDVESHEYSSLKDHEREFCTLEEGSEGRNSNLSWIYRSIFYFWNYGKEDGIIFIAGSPNIGNEFYIGGTVCRA